MTNQPADDDGVPVEQVAAGMRRMLDGFHALQVENALPWAQSMLETIKRELGEDLLAHNPDAERLLADYYRRSADDTREKARAAAVQKFGIQI